MAMPESITINGTSYSTANLSEAARNQIANIQFVDAEIVRLQQQLAITQTARNSYVAALTRAVETPAEQPPE